MAVFPGLPAEGVKFLSALARNNRREWFQPRKHIYEEQLKAPMAELVMALNSEMMRFRAGLRQRTRQSYLSHLS